ncbi:hypothetical protein BDV95DRAFT_219576 [Massariosphaeria phaeospora]|uniref:Uncharacterized protein n=1 Tax=Massariosphaeria phaeospora TaxID=100035 RepID=A0A7C8ME86_9PLEO|nr:hypothetical protein BDV95DRAFT_219576 [Massariosphaeria phaeospora]
MNQTLDSSKYTVNHIHISIPPAQAIRTCKFNMFDPFPAKAPLTTTPPQSVYDR